MSDLTQAEQNKQMVEQLMAEAAAEKANTLQQGSAAGVAVPIDYTSDSGQHFSGTVFFRRPSAMDYIRIGAIKSELLRGFGVRPIIDMIPDGAGGMRRVETMAHVDSTIQVLARAVATLDVLITSCPDWLKNHREIEHTDLLMHVYMRFDEDLYSFRNGTQGVPAGDHPAGDR